MPYTLQEHFFLLTLPKDDLPSTLVIGRPFNHQAYNFPKEDFIKKYGSRASYFGIPFAGLSVRSDADSVGHAVLHFDVDGSFTVTDLNTANHTEVATELRSEIESELYGMIFNPEFPLSYKLGFWCYGIEDSHNFQRIESEPVKFQSTIILRLAKEIVFVIGDIKRPPENLLNNVADQWKKVGKGMSFDLVNMMYDYFKEKKR